MKAIQRFFQTAFFILFSFVTMYAQDAKGVVIGDESLEPTAILELESTDKGLLIPRMETDDRDGITNPASGLMIYNEDNGIFNKNYNGWREFDDDWRRILDAGTNAPTNHIIHKTGNVGIGKYAAFADLYIETRAENDFSLIISDPNDEDDLLVTSDGEVGIGGYVPWADLFVKNRVGNDFTFVVSDSDSNFDFLVSDDGNVGVGATHSDTDLTIINKPGNPLALLIEDTNDDRILSIASDKSFEFWCGIQTNDAVELKLEGFFDNEPAFFPKVEGYGDVGKASNKWFRMYANTYFGTNLSIQSISDRNLKTNIEPLANGLNQLMQLNPVTYDFIADKVYNSPEAREKANDKDLKNQMGLIAQEVETIFPNLVRFLDDEKTTKTLGYSGLIPIMIQATKEQQDIIETQKTEINALKTKYDNLLKRLEALENR